MDISLIICTYNRHKQLQECLNSISKLKTKHCWELVVVDNASTDETQHTLKRFLKNAEFPIQVVNESKRGLGNARNAGINASKGKVLAFTDDDCYPEEDYLDKVLECFEDSDIAFIGGRILLFDPEDFPTTIITSTKRVDYSSGEFIPAGAIQGANMSFRKDVLLAIDGFDPLMGAGKFIPAEDIEAIGKVSAKGWAGAYDPRPVVLHHHGRKTKAQAAVLMKKYDYGRGAYYLKSIFRKPVRRATITFWKKRISSQGRKTTLREIYGALFYIALKILPNKYSDN